MGAFFAAVSAHHDLAELPHGPLFGVTDEPTFATLAASGGLRGLELSRHEIAWRCENLEAVLAGFWDWGNLAGLAPSKQERIRATMREHCSPFACRGGFIFPHSVLLGRAGALEAPESPESPGHGGTT